MPLPYAEPRAVVVYIVCIDLEEARQFQAADTCSKAVADGLAGGTAAERLVGLGSEIATPEQLTPQGFAEFLRTDYDDMGAAAKLAGITPQ